MPDRWAGRRLTCVAIGGGIVVSTIIDLFDWGHVDQRLEFLAADGETPSAALRALLAIMQVTDQPRM